MQFLSVDLQDQLRITASAFVILVLLGFVFGILFPQQTDDYISRVTEQIGSADIVSDNGSINVVNLFLNNVWALAITLLYGFLPILYLPVLPLGLNASLLGLMAAYYVHHDISLLLFLAALLPHGIFELPAMVLSYTLALYLCRGMTKQFRTLEGTKLFLPAIKNIFRVYFLFVIPLLAVAAIMESYITPLVMGLFI